MDVLNSTNELQDYLQDTTYKLGQDNLFPNQALRLLYDKKLLTTLNKAISDTAFSCFNYIVKKKTESHNSYERSNDNVIHWLNTFSTDFVEVLSSIIKQSKNNFVKDRLNVDLAANGINTSDCINDNYSNSICSPQRLVETHPTYMRKTPQLSYNKSTCKTPSSKKKNLKNSIRKNLFSNLKPETERTYRNTNKIEDKSLVLTNSTGKSLNTNYTKNRANNDEMISYSNLIKEPQKSQGKFEAIEFDKWPISNYSKNWGWNNKSLMDKSMEKLYRHSKERLSCKYLRESKSRNRNSGIGASSTSYNYSTSDLLTNQPNYQRQVCAF